MFKREHYTLNVADLTIRHNTKAIFISGLKTMHEAVRELNRLEAEEIEINRFLDTPHQLVTVTYRTWRKRP